MFHVNIKHNKSLRAIYHKTTVKNILNNTHTYLPSICMYTLPMHQKYAHSKGKDKQKSINLYKMSVYMYTSQGSKIHSP